MLPTILTGLLIAGVWTAGLGAWLIHYNREN